MEAVILFSLLIVTIGLSIPIGITLGLSTGIAMWLTSDIPMVMLAQKSVTGLDSFPLLAIPFFILAGALMCNGGISRRLVNLAESLVGYITGGLAMVTIVACMFFGAISGSAGATVSAIGSFMVPMMVEKKYKPDFAAAVISSAGTIGCIIPPSIPFVVYGVLTGTSVSDLFIAGVIPGVTIGLALMAVAYVISKKEGYPPMSGIPTFRQVVKTFAGSIWALFVPIIILGGIYGGIFTPTEAAAVAAVYGLFVGVCIYRTLRARELLAVVIDSGRQAGAIMWNMGNAGLMAWVMSVSGISATITHFLESVVNGHTLVFLLIANILVLIAGCFIDGNSIMYIFVPIFMPIATALGVDLYHLGVVLVMNVAIGQVPPPVGCNLFVACGIGGIQVADIVRPVVPYIIASAIALLIVTLVPGVSTLLPALLG